MKLSVVIPAYNEAESLPETIQAIYKELVNNNIEHEILVINDNSTDGGSANIRLDSPNPDIEFVETDQASPAGKYEIAVQGDALQINGRNATAFENFIEFHRTAKTPNNIFVIKLPSFGFSIYTYPC